MSRIVLPPLYDWQAEIYKSKARFKVLAIGRRAGKSYLAKLIAMDRAINYGENVWIVYPAYSTAGPHFNEMLKTLDNTPFTTRTHRQERIFEFTSGGYISFKSGDKSNNLRGSGLDLVIMDEAAFIPSGVFYDICLPALADKQGDALLISTPLGKNWFYDVWLLGQNKKEDDWQSWQLPSDVNPLITKEERKRQKQLQPAITFRQEFLASFEGSGGGAFVGIEEAAVNEPLEGPVKGRSYTMGVDWGRHEDYTVVSVFDIYSGEQVWMDRFTDIGYEVQSARVISAIRKWEPDYTFVETNSLGGPMFEKLKTQHRKEGLPGRLRGVHMNNATKRNLVERFGAYLENGRITIFSGNTPLGSEQISELSVFAVKRTHSGLNITYSAPKGHHDDIVIANILAVKGIRQRQSSVLQPAPNKFYGAKVDFI